MKICSKCKAEKNVSEFYYSHKESKTRRSDCIPCYLESKRSRKARNSGVKNAATPNPTLFTIGSKLRDATSLNDLLNAWELAQS